MNVTLAVVALNAVAVPIVGALGTDGASGSYSSPTNSALFVTVTVLGMPAPVNASSMLACKSVVVQASIGYSAKATESFVAL